MKKIFLFLSILPFIVFSQNENKIMIGISPGINISRLKIDSLSNTSVFLPLIGVNATKPLSKHFDFTGGVQYSLRGSNTSGSYPKFRNQYVDVFLNPKIKFLNIFRIGVGGQYSYLLSSKEKKLSGNQTLGEIYQSIKGFHSQAEVFANAELMLVKGIFFQAKYSIPINKEYTNLQFSLNFIINQGYFKPKKKEEIKVSLSEIEQLKSGVLLVRLQTQNPEINALKEKGLNNQAEQELQNQALYNKTIINAFKNKFNFCPVYFFFSDNSEKVRNKEFKNIFLNDNLAVDSTIKINPLFYFTAEFGFTEQDTAESTYKSVLYEKNDSGSLEHPEYHYGSPDMRLDALVIKSDQFVQLSKPFPYYAKINKLLSVKSQVEDAVELMNTKLKKYYSETKK